MQSSSYHILIRALVGGTLAVAVPTAWAQPNKLDHFRCYIVSKQTPQPPTIVTLNDQFLTNGVTLTVNEPLLFCAPVSKNLEPIQNPEDHLTMYAAAANLNPHLIISTRDQFGPRTLEAVGARVLIVPTQKTTVDGTATGHPAPQGLNHFWCHEVSDGRLGLRVDLQDQFGADVDVRVVRPRLFCNPARKVVAGVPTPIEDADAHLTCYEIRAPQRKRGIVVGIVNQFETDTFRITASELLCLPSEKLGFEPVP